jgi:dipeptidyl-peptidase-4
VQTDSSKVTLRAMLVPGDPSYPEVQETRFARVIPSLKVGVVDAGGGETKWLPIPTHIREEGFYLGQVDYI